MESARAERHCRIHKERLITSNSISSSRPGVSSTRPRRFKNPVPEKKSARENDHCGGDASLLSFSEIYWNWERERIFRMGKKSSQGKESRKGGVGEQGKRRGYHGQRQRNGSARSSSHCGLDTANCNAERVVPPLSPLSLYLSRSLSLSLSLSLWSLQIFAFRSTTWLKNRKIGTVR